MTFWARFKFDMLVLKFWNVKKEMYQVFYVKLNNVNQVPLIARWELEERTVVTHWFDYDILFTKSPKNHQS